MSWAENIQREFASKEMDSKLLCGTEQQIPITTPVVYDDAEHVYTLNQQKYIGASSLYEDFHEKFPADAHIKYAEKHGNTPEYWKQKWEEKNLLSRVRGNKIHDANEVSDHGRMINIYEGQQVSVIGPGYEDNYPWIERPDGVYTERMVWHHGYKIAGRIDKTIILTDNTPIHGFGVQRGPLRYANIEDYKTNAKLDFKSFQFRNGSYKMMKYPIAHLMDCNWIHYAIQQSVYMLCLEYQGFLPGRITIKHYPHPTADNPNPKPVEYEVPYLKKEVLAMCKCK
jgi:hypothetical protein